MSEPQPTPQPTPSPAAAPGWYPDPNAPGCVRWFDGTAWTEHVRAAVTGVGDDPGMRWLLPVGRSGWAVAAGYLGLLSVLLLPAPFALATGILGVRSVRRHEHLHGMGRAIFGIVMGALGTIGLAAAVFGSWLSA